MGVFRDLSGSCKKMPAKLASDGKVEYQIALDEHSFALNDCIGKTLKITFPGAIHCIACGKKTKKSFSQGHCFRCMKVLPQCDQCIMSPERCHYFAGTCRDAEWGERNCMTDHIVYLANTTAAKVGITRASQIPTRWIDQGAEQALPIMRVATRQQAGFVEDALREHIADKTNWRNMLKNKAEPLDLEALRDQLFEKCVSELAELEDRFGADSLERLSNSTVVTLDFPVAEYPKKITSFNLDKTPEAEGVLQGVKGQYLIFDTGVINLRKYTGYNLNIQVLA